MQKAQADVHEHGATPSNSKSANGDAQSSRTESSTIHEAEKGKGNGSLAQSEGTTLAASTSVSGDADDDASTRGVVSPTHSIQDSAEVADASGITNATVDTDADDSNNNNGIPTIKISTESEVEAEHQRSLQSQSQSHDAIAAAGEEAGSKDAADVDVDAQSSDITSPEIPINASTTNGAVRPSLEKPLQAAASENGQMEGESPITQEPFSFSNKRLCERWLDNLFMVLYEVNDKFFFIFCIMSTYSCWVCRICEYGRSSVLRLLISRRSTLRTARQASNGRS